MTERQKALLENLPKCNHNVNKAAKMSGYSEMTANKAIYTMLGKNRIKGIKSAEEVKERYLKKVKKLQKKMLSDKDNTNLMRSVEIEGKVEGLFKETVVNEGNQKEITVVYGNTDKPIVQANDNDTNLVSINPINNTPYNNTVLDTPKDTKVLEDNGKVDSRVGGGDGE